MIVVADTSGIIASIDTDDPEHEGAPLRAARVVQARYDDLGLDLADAVITVVARDYDTNAVLTLNRRDFRALRPLTEDKAFRILPDDL